MIPTTLPTTVRTRDIKQIRLHPPISESRIRKDRPIVPQTIYNFRLNLAVFEGENRGATAGFWGRIGVRIGILRKVEDVPFEGSAVWRVRDIVFYSEEDLECWGLLWVADG